MDGGYVGELEALGILHVADKLDDCRNVYGGDKAEVDDAEE